MKEANANDALELTTKLSALNNQNALDFAGCQLLKLLDYYICSHLITGSSKTTTSVTAFEAKMDASSVQETLVTTDITQQATTECKSSPLPKSINVFITHLF
jgi:hypothetical protein